jgi:hypothetical protein
MIIIDALAVQLPLGGIHVIRYIKKLIFYRGGQRWNRISYRIS